MKFVKYSFGIAAAMLASCGPVGSENDAEETLSDYSLDGGVMTVAAGDRVLLDNCNLKLRQLNVFGELIVSDEGFVDCKTASLEVETIVVSGQNAKLVAGTVSQPLTVPWTITLTGDINSPSTSMAEPRQIMVMKGAQLELYGESGDKISWSSLSVTARVGDMFITVAEDTGWQPGDKVVIASSSIDPREAEVVEIAYIDEISKTIWLTAPLKFNHFGEQQIFAGKTIDTRAEVGLLSHTIIIQGDDTSEYTGIGGNIMVMNAGMDRPASSDQTLLRPSFEGRASSVLISGVELRSMGQRGRAGRYPMHWHLVDDGSESVVRNISVHNSLQRAVVVHGTDGVTVDSVVGYHVPNHMFVPSEEGDEAHNRFINNLGVLSLPVKPEHFAFTASNNSKRSDQSEERSSVFWLRSSFNELRGNRAAGALNGQGFFIDHGGMNKRSIKFAQAASGGSEICDFDDNLAHSIYVGLGSPDLYTPLAKGFGLFTTSHERNGDTHCTLSGFRAYKTQNGGMWTENSTIIEDMLVTDSHIGVVAGDVIRDAVVVGQTKNQLTTNPDRSRGGFVQSNNGGQRIDGRVFEGLTCINLPTCFFAQTGDSGVIEQLTGARISDVTLIATKQGFSIGEGALSFGDDSITFGQFTDVDGALTGKPGSVGNIDSDVFLRNTDPFINRWGWEWNDTPVLGE